MTFENGSSASTACITPPLSPLNQEKNFSRALFIGSLASFRNEKPLNTTTNYKKCGNFSNLIRENLHKILIVIGSFIVYFIADGVSLSFGIFTRELVEYFDKQDDESSVFITNGLIQAVPLFLSPLVCYLIEKFSCRLISLIGSVLLALSFILVRFVVRDLLTLNMIIGIMASCGLAMIYIPAYLIISFYFEERRALATGVAVSGSGLGLFAFSPLTEYLIDKYGWQDTILIFGALSCHTFISALLFRSNDTQKLEKNEIIEDRIGNIKLNRVRSVLEELKFIFSSRNFLLIIVSYVILSFSNIAPHNFLPSHIKHQSLEDPSSISISLIGFSTLVGQIAIGYVSDIFRKYNWLIFALCLVIGGVATLLVPILHSINLVYVFSVFFGFFTSVNYVLQSTLVIESGLGTKNLTLAFGCLQLCQGFSVLFGTPILSYFKDKTGDYNLTFYISGLFMVLAGLFFSLWPLFHRKNAKIQKQQQKKRKEKIQYTENMRLTVSTEVPLLI
jgi:MFS family permease